jgi:hypothetical protein
MINEPPVEFAPQPGPMIAYATPEPLERPTSLLVITIVGIIYAGLGLLYGVLSLASFALFMAYMRQQTGPLGASFQLGWNVTFVIGGMTLAGLLLWSSIAAMRMREAGRAWMLRWAWAYIAWKVFMLGTQALVIIPAAMATAASSSSTAGAPAGPRMMSMPPNARLFLYVGPLFSLAVSLVFPAFVLSFMNRAPVRDAYRRALAQGLTGGGGTTFAGDPQPMLGPQPPPAF